MKRVLTILLFTLLTVMPAFGQDKPAAKPAPVAAMPSLDQIIEKAVQAIGGKAAHEKLTSRVAKGTLEVSGTGGPFETYAKAPNKTITIVDIEGYGVYQEGFDGAVAWVLDPASGMSERQGTALATAKREADFYGAFKIKEHFPKMTLKGKDKVGDREVYVIDAITAEGTPETLYIDVQNGLILRMDMVRETPQGKVSMELYMEDYREVDGIKLPFTLRQNADVTNITIKLTEVKHNVAIEDAKFKKPTS